MHSLLVFFHTVYFVQTDSKVSIKYPDLCFAILHSDLVNIVVDKRKGRSSIVYYGFHSAPFSFPDECNNFCCHFVGETEICSIKHAMLKWCLGYELRELGPLLVSTASLTSHRHGEMKVTEEEHLNQHKPSWQVKVKLTRKIAPFFFLTKKSKVKEEKKIWPYNDQHLIPEPPASFKITNAISP